MRTFQLCWSCKKPVGVAVGQKTENQLKAGQLTKTLYR